MEGKAHLPIGIGQFVVFSFAKNICEEKIFLEISEEFERIQEKIFAKFHHETPKEKKNWSKRLKIAEKWSEIGDVRQIVI